MTDERGPALSVVIPARDAATTLTAQLRAVLASAHDVDVEVVVVDNRSTDDTAAVVRSASLDDPRIRLVAASARDNPCYARNVGIRAATSERIALCDADDEVGPNWASAMAAALGTHDYVAGPLDIETLNPAWARCSRGAITSFTEKPLFAGQLPFAHGCNVGISRSAWQAADGFDETIAHGEDVDFGLRLWRAGVALHFEPAATVRYRYRATVPAMARQSYIYGLSWPQNCRRLREAGLPTPRRAAGLRRFGWLVRNFPRLRDRAGRARWTWVLANEAGRIRGSVRQRAVYV